jgi:asparagine synthase (glutamine-hydrolysing)
VCGLAGFWDPRGVVSDPSECLVRMTDVIAHRGPDDQQVFFDADAGLGLGFRRLSIIDLSPEGRQPMTSASGRYVMVFNGEVYNFESLRPELLQAGAQFRGHSDTEVILAAVEAWGLASALERFNGMFALALWDRRERELHLVRDRLGIKPLYYGQVGGAVVFGSDPACFREFPGYTGDIDRGALCLYLRHSYVPGPWCIQAGIRKLLPGHRLVIADPGNNELPASVPWWSARQAVTRGLENPFTGTATDAVERLEKVLADAVKSRMVADVPLGAFLSGGIDSSTVVALMQAGHGSAIRTFSIGFEDSEFNEAGYAAEVAAHLGTRHTELYVSPKDCLDVIPLLPGMFSEPFADSSQIPTYLVSRLARSQVTVSLSGDGGDELFAGYHNYAFGSTLWNRAGGLPAWLRSTATTVTKGIPTGTWDLLLRLVRPFDSGGREFPVTGDRVHKLADVLGQKDFRSMYRALVSGWKNPSQVVVGGWEPPSLLQGLDPDPPNSDPVASMMYWDLMTYLPDDILTKVDRASMAVSLEARVPLLDHRVVEYAWRLPQEYKIRDGQSKWVLRGVLDRHVPRTLIDRPKRGFGVPLASWLRGPLRDWAETLLGADRLAAEGIFRPRVIRRTWEEFLSGKRQWQGNLWTVLMFQAWLESQREPSEKGRP